MGSRVAPLSLVPLMPGSDLEDVRTRQRIAVFRSAYGIDEFPEDALSVAVERCRREADLIYRLGAAGENPYAHLLAEGHGEVWSAAATHIASRTSGGRRPEAFLALSRLHEVDRKGFRDAKAP